MMWRKSEKSENGMFMYIAGKLKKAGGGSPTGEAVSALFKRMDADDAWFPGKSYQKSFGPTPLLTATNKGIIARGMMSRKETGEEPTYGTTIANYPKATLKPKAKKPFSKKMVYAD